MLPRPSHSLLFLTLFSVWEADLTQVGCGHRAPLPSGSGRFQPMKNMRLEQENSDSARVSMSWPCLVTKGPSSFCAALSKGPGKGSVSLLLQSQRLSAPLSPVFSLHLTHTFANGLSIELFSKLPIRVHPLLLLAGDWFAPLTRPRTVPGTYSMQSLLWLLCYLQSKKSHAWWMCGSTINFIVRGLLFLIRCCGFTFMN